MSVLNLKNELESLSGQACCRVQVNEEYNKRRLSLGFGKKIPHDKSLLPFLYYGEWEVGSYLASWRVVSKNKIVAGSNELVDDLGEVDRKLLFLLDEKIIDICNTSVFDVRLIMSNDVYVDFMWVSSDDDEVFHLFAPEKRYVSYTVACGWRT